MPPIPSQFVYESRIDATVGNQISPPTTINGIATISVSAILSRAERRTARALRCTPSTFSILVATSVAIASSISLLSRSEDRHLLLLDAAHKRVHVVGLVEELLERRDHHRRREVRPRVAVEVLRDVCRLRDQCGRLLLDRVV